MKQYIIYRVINLVNRKIYIGRTTTTLKKRWSVHKAHAKHNGRYKRAGESYLYRSMRKYGIENFEIKEIDRAIDFIHMAWLEAFYIRYYQSTDPRYGYNLIIDKYGDGREFMAEESKLKLCISSHIASGPCGVGWDKYRQKWYMKIYFLKEGVCKRFDTEEEAKIARDKLSLFFYKENAQLFFPERKQQYINDGIELFYSKMKYKRPQKSKYIGVRPDAGGFTVTIRGYNRGKDVYLGFYKSEDEAVLAYDQVATYLKKKTINFPDRVTPDYITEGERIYRLYTDPARPIFRHNGKTSRYNGVNKRSSKTWEMSLVVAGHNRVREVYLDEKDAALAHDFYVRKLGGNLSKLNFPEIVMSEKPQHQPTKQRSKLQKFSCHAVQRDIVEDTVSVAQGPMFPPK